MGGGDKCLRTIGGVTILARIIDRVQDQVSRLAINANGDPQRFAEFSLPVVADVVPDFAGPLAGVLSGMEWAAEYEPDCRWIASIPTDAPFLPTDLIAKLSEVLVRENAELACAASGGQVHPVVGLWPVEMRAQLRQALVVEDIRKIDVFTVNYRLAEVTFDVDPVDPFFNTNRPEDLQEAERLIKA
jgi:molybdopterin-guanine dinucleotide biosynthesis protein A